MKNTALKLRRPRRAKIRERHRPKPEGAIEQALAYMTAAYWRAPHVKEALRMMRYIADRADLVDLPTPEDRSNTRPIESGVAWLLVPAPRWLLDGIAAFEADLENLESDGDLAQLESDETLPDRLGRVPEGMGFNV